MFLKRLFRPWKHKPVKKGMVCPETFAVRSMDVQLNTFCNADCFFCIAHDKNLAAIDFESFQILSKHVHMKTVEELIFTGGEPTVNKDLGRILRYVYQEYPCTRVRLITNAIHLPPDLMDSLFLGNMASLHVSINAANPEDYLRITGVNKFEAVHRNVRRIIEKRKNLGLSTPTVCVSMVLVKQNMSNVVPLVDLACELGLDSVYILNASLSAELSNSSPFGDPETLTEIFEQAQKVSSAKRITLGLPISQTSETRIINCEEPWRKVFVATGGEVNPCCGYDFRVSHDEQRRGNLLQQDLREFWYSGLYDSIRHGLKTSDPLPGCRQCYKQMFKES